MIVGAIGFAGQLKSSTMFQKIIKTCQHTEKVNDGAWTSHCFLVTVPFAVFEEQVQEASLEISTVPLANYRNDPNARYEIYGIRNVDQSKMVALLTEVWKMYAEQTYGFLQLLWFVWRAFNNIIHRKIKGEKNWFRKGIICSGLVYRFFDLLWKKYDAKDFRATVLSIPWDEDTVWPLDIYTMVKNFPALFPLLERKDASGVQTFNS